MLNSTDPKPQQNSGKALWYIDNESIFVCTDDGYICRYDLEGKLLARALIHERTKINGIGFSKDFSVLGTAADNGSKIIDPETL
jgi:WD40 repeat protein